jgi:hypothetical protein
MTMSDEPAGGWKVGDGVTYAPRFSFDATYHKGVIVAIDIVDGPDGLPHAKFTVESPPPLGFGRVQLELTHLRERWEPTFRPSSLNQ